MATESATNGETRLGRLPSVRTVGRGLLSALGLAHRILRVGLTARHGIRASAERYARTSRSIGRS